MRALLVSSVAILVPRIIHLLVATGGILVLASCGSAIETATAPTQQKCGVDANAQDVSFPAAGGTGTVHISTNRECTWSVQSDAAWLTVSSPVTGQGAASIQYSVAANTDPPSRTAHIRVENQQVVISQEGTPCEYRLSSTNESVDQSGGERTIQVSTSSAQCRWTAAVDVPWIIVAAGHSGGGNGAVSFTVDATDGPERTGTITIAGLVVAVTQAPGCRYVVDPSTSTVAASGGMGIVSIRTGAGCSWTAASSADWLTLSPASGSGPGDVRFSVAPWTGPSRSATLRIAGQTSTVNQGSGCTVSFSPAMLSVAAPSTRSAVQVSAMPGCPWSATSGAPWITIESGAAGSGDGQVQLIVAANSGPARQGALLVAGKSLPVTQANGCTYAATPIVHTISATAWTGTVLVSTASACRWVASSQVAWVTVQESSIVGTGVLTFTVAPNSGPARTGTFTAAGHTITVNQAGGSHLSAGQFASPDSRSRFLRARLAPLSLDQLFAGTVTREERSGRAAPAHRQSRMLAAIARYPGVHYSTVSRMVATDSDRAKKWQRKI